MPPIHRCNFLPAVIVGLLLWITCGLIILFLDPEKKSQLLITNYQLLVYPNTILFFFVLTLSLTITLALLFGNTRRGFLVSLFIAGVLLFRFNKTLYWWNTGLIAIVLTLTEAIFQTKSKKIDSPH